MPILHPHSPLSQAAAQLQHMHPDLFALQQEGFQDRINLSRPSKHSEENDKPDFGLMVELGKYMRMEASGSPVRHGVAETQIDKEKEMSLQSGLQPSLYGKLCALELVQGLRIRYRENPSHNVAYEAPEIKQGEDQPKGQPMFVVGSI
jgi:hypothetical protein